MRTRSSRPRLARTCVAVAIAVVAGLPVQAAAAVGPRQGLIAPAVEWTTAIPSSSAPPAVRVRPYGVVAHDLLLDPLDGQVVGEVPNECLGDGPVGLDVLGRFEGPPGAPGDLLLFAVDEATGEVGAAPLGRITAPSDHAASASCSIQAGAGDLAMVEVTAQTSESFFPRSRYVTVRITEDGMTEVWETGGAFCPSTAVGRSGTAPVLLDTIVVRNGTDCSQRILRAFDAQTGEELDALPIGEAYGVPIAPVGDGRVGALVGAAAYDLRPTPEGFRWVPRWDAGPDVGDHVAVSASRVFFRVGEELLALDAGTGVERVRLPWPADASAPVASSGETFARVEHGTDLVLYGPDPGPFDDDDPDIADGQVLHVLEDVHEQVGIPADAELRMVFDGDLSLYVAAQRDAETSVVARVTFEGERPDPRGVRRIAGGDPIEVAIEACRRIEPTYQQADRVVIARSDVFADALAGAALAGPNGCILYVDGGPDGPLDPRTLYETARVIPAGGRVHILGGTNAVSSAIEAGLSATGYAVERIAGPDRVATAAQIARVVAARTGGTTATAYLATAATFPDAVTAGAHAAFAGIPVLLTDPATLSPATAEALAELGVQRTVVLGGTGAISDAVHDAVPGPQRVSGANRFGTVAAIATQLWGSGGVAPDGWLGVALDRPDSWQAALVGAPLAASLGVPQLGFQAHMVPTETRELWEATASTPTDLIVLGDRAVIPARTLQDLTTP